MGGPEHAEDGLLTRARKVARECDATVADLQRIADERFAGQLPQEFQDMLARAERRREAAWKVVAAVEAGQPPDPAWFDGWE
jgi:hypothetical protein